MVLLRALTLDLGIHKQPGVAPVIRYVKLKYVRASGKREIESESGTVLKAIGPCALEDLTAVQPDDCTIVSRKLASELVPGNGNGTLCNAEL